MAVQVREFSLGTDLPRLSQVHPLLESSLGLTAGLEELPEFLFLDSFVLLGESVLVGHVLEFGLLLLDHQTQSLPEVNSQQFVPQNLLQGLCRPAKELQGLIDLPKVFEVDLLAHLNA